jgi:hypothetical protein
MKKISATALFFTTTMLLSVSVAFAQSASGGDICSGDPLTQLFCSTNLSQMLNSIFQAAIALGGILAMMRIAYAGWLYMGSADMWSSKTHAKEVFREAIIGLLILLSVWLVLYQINPDILKLQILQVNT